MRASATDTVDSHDATLGSWPAVAQLVGACTSFRDVAAGSPTTEQVTL